MSIQKFNYNELPVRAFNDTENNIWFVGYDVAKVLGYKKPQKAIMDNVDDDDKKKVSEVTTAPGKGSSKKLNSNRILINESGLYSLILRSKLPSAKQFKRWVTSEVLTSLRKTGSYQMSQDNRPDEVKNLERAKALKSLYDMYQDMNFEFEPRERLIIKDKMKDIIFSDKMAIQGSNNRLEYPISDRIVELGYKYNKKICMKLGNLFKAKYINLFNKDPPKREQYVEGATRMVRSYTINDYQKFGDKLIHKYFK